jgi:molybdenum cofactor synthesis domain-containing protein
MATSPTAAVLLIGDELLSGRTQDTNLKSIADFLAPLGVEIREARIVSDIQEEIVAALNALRAKHAYVFTTGGIGPTHDDITADAVAAAFGVSIDIDPRARDLLVPYIQARGLEVTEGRLRMARIPAGAELIANPVSVAPGFKLGNVFVMAGIPSVMRGMLRDVEQHIEAQIPVVSRTVRSHIGEGDLSKPLGDLAKATTSVSFGSYPFTRRGDDGQVRFGVNLVARGRDAAAVDAAARALVDLVRSLGGDPVLDPET